MLFHTGNILILGTLVLEFVWTLHTSEWDTDRTPTCAGSQKPVLPSTYLKLSPVLTIRHYELSLQDLYCFPPMYSTCLPHRGMCAVEITILRDQSSGLVRWLSG